jgi:hypothetical protein
MAWLYRVSLYPVVSAGWFHAWSVGVGMFLGFAVLLMAVL